MLLGEVLFQALHLCRKAFHVKVVNQNLQQLDSKKDSFFCFGWSQSTTCSHEIRFNANCLFQWGDLHLWKKMFSKSESLVEVAVGS